MKIVMVGKFPPYVGGVERHSYMLAKRLVSEGHEVFVINYPHSDIKDIDGVHVIGAKMIDLPYFREFSFVLSAMKILEDLVKKEDIDIIHGHMVFSGGWAATKVGKKYNIPTYVTVHGGDTPRFTNNPLVIKIIKKVLNDADNVLAVSEDILKEILNLDVKNIESKTQMHRNAVDINKFNEYPSANRKPVVISIARFDKRKKLDLLLDAKKQTKNDFDLILVGDGAERGRLEDKVRKENIKGVTFTGIRFDVENILPHADLFVLPSVNEAFGIVYIEALACGLPVIGCEDSGVKEIINEDVGLLVKPNDIDSLSQAIDKILTDKKLYNKFKSNARRRAIDFSELKIPYKEINLN